MDIETQLQSAEAIVHRIVKDPNVADDVFQDLCVECMKRSDVDWTIPQEGCFVRIAQWLQINRFRQAARRRECSLGIPDFECLQNTGLSQVSNPNQQEKMHELLLALPEKYRRAIELRFVQNSPDELLAAEMSVDVATVRKWRSRGIQELRSLLSGQGLEVTGSR